MSDKEWEIFKEKVQPIKASGKVNYVRKKTAAKSVQERKAIKVNLNEINLEEQSEAIRRLDKNILRKIKKGNLIVEESLDLHGYTLEESKEKVVKFIEKNYENKKRFVLIITGKGRRLGVSDGWKGEGKLKENVPHWLSSVYLSKYILWFDRATSDKGGDGALMVYLKKSKNEFG
jgi:DNA-nicking Smr family endonuclease